MHEEGGDIPRLPNMVLAHSAIGLVISACQCLKEVTYRKDASELKLNVGASEGRAKPQQTRPLDGPATRR